MAAPRLRVLNFHPIHLYLNPEQVETYERARPYTRDASRLKECRTPDADGTRSFFADVIRVARTSSLDFGCIRDITPKTKTH